MQLQLPTALLLTLITAISAVPAPQSTPPSTPFQYRQLIFQLNGPDNANHVVTIPADGNSHITSRPQPFPTHRYAENINFLADTTLSVSTINLTTESPDFNIYILCNYYTPNSKSITIGEPDDGRNVNVGPPQEVTSIACQPTSSEPGRCLPNYGE